MPVEIKVFPNTGHQYFTFSLDQLCNQLWKRNANDLRALVRRNLDRPWAVWPDYPWIRYKYEMVSSAGSLTPDTPVIHLAVATHMSIPDKSLLYEVQSGLGEGKEGNEVFPYACDSATALKDTLGEPPIVQLYSLPDPSASGSPERRLEDVFVHFMIPGAAEPVDVDLVVDLGNTRTAALLVESRAAGQGVEWPFERRVRRLRFYPPGIAPDRLQKDQSIIPSWFLVHRTTFASLEPPLSVAQLSDRYEEYAGENGERLFRCKRFYPRAFVELSPVRIGGGNDARGCASSWATAPYGYAYAFSSPKRYVWDDSPLGSQGQRFWRQLKNVEDADRQASRSMDHELDGLIRMYMDPTGHDWDIDSPPSESESLARFEKQPPSYPRRDSICWFALAVIESAARQINSPEHIRDVGFLGVPRRLRHIMVTYPAAWSHEVKDAYYKQWERAINLFTLGHFDADQHPPIAQGGMRPELVQENINEAICSQLPILYSDIGTLMRQPELWVQLYGDSEKSVVVMNLDIGGGTTDLTVIRYAFDSQKRALQPHLLFQDGCSTAGDILVKKIIEKLVIPAWLKSAGAERLASVPDSLKWICSLFADPANQHFSDMEPQAAEKMIRITRLAFVPVVNVLLSRVASLGDRSAVAQIEVVVNPGVDTSAGESDVFVFNQVLAELNKMVDAVVRSLCPREHLHWRGSEVFPSSEVTLRFSLSEVEDAVEEVFGKFCRSISGVVTRHNCHMVVVTGKPSELPKLRQIITQSFQMLPQRIIYAKDFPAGKWYPFGAPGTRPEDLGRINDAKTCTVVGAALYLDSITNPQLTDMFTIEHCAGELQGRYFWGVVTGEGDGEDFFDEKRNLLFKPDEYQLAHEDDAGRKILEKKLPFKLVINHCRIGRHLVGLEGMRPEQPEMVYELCFRAKPGRTIGTLPRTPAHVTLRWTLDPALGESLALVACEPEESDADLSGAEPCLRINTMLENSYWLDDPKFHCDYEALLR